MRGTIKSRTPGSYTLRFDTGIDAITGKRKQETLTIHGTRRQAEEKLNEMINQVSKGIYIQSGKTTLAAYLEQWLRDYAKPNLTPRSYERYETICKNHIIASIGNVPLTGLRPEHLQKLYTAKLNSGLAPRTVRYIHTVCHKALATGLKWGMVSRNVADAVEAPHPGHTEMKTWGEYEVSKFLEATKDSQYYPLFYAALFTGMRRSELLGLRWTDIDLLYGQISVSRGLHHLKDGSYVFNEPKSAKSKRTIALPPSAILILTQHYERQRELWRRTGRDLSDDTLVFCTIEGRPYRPNTITRAWTILAARAGVPVINFHAARHTHASLMLKQGVHPKVVQERLGHSTITTTLDIYSHVAPGMQEAAAKHFDEMLSVRYNDAVSNTSREQNVSKAAK